MTLAPAFRAPSAILGPDDRPVDAVVCADRLQLQAAQEHRAAAPVRRSWYDCCSRRRVVRLAVVLAVPASGTQQLVHALRFLASPTSLEPGCLGCRVWTEDSDASFVRYEEVWATEEAMRLRVRSEGFTRVLEVLESAPKAPSVQFDFVTETRGLDYVEEVRKMDGSLGTDRKSLRTWLLLVGALFSTTPL